jgi:uncharacterized UPF0146 family protein
MARTKKKRDDRILTYVRLQPEIHRQIVQIAEARGYPHTIASVATEMVSHGLKSTHEST